MAKQTMMSMEGKSTRVFGKPRRRMTKDVPTTLKAKVRPLAAWPKNPMKRAKAWVAATGSSGYRASNWSLAST